MSERSKIWHEANYLQYLWQGTRRSAACLTLRSNVQLKKACNWWKSPESAVFRNISDGDSECRSIDTINIQSLLSCATSALALTPTPSMHHCILDEKFMRTLSQGIHQELNYRGEQWDTTTQLCLTLALSGTNTTAIRICPLPSVPSGV